MTKPDRAARVVGRRGGRDMAARVRGTLISKGIRTDDGGYDTIVQIVRREVKRAVEEEREAIRQLCTSAGQHALAATIRARGKRP